MPESSNIVKQLENCSADAIADEVLTSTEPLLLKGLVADWPVVQAGKKSAKAAAQYIQGFDRDTPLTAYEGPPDINGRIFYNEEFTGFNFSRTRQTLKQVLDKLFQVIEKHMHLPIILVLQWSIIGCQGSAPRMISV